MNHFTFSAVLVFFTSLLAALYFIPKSGEHRYFGLFWLSVSFWTFFVGFQFPILDKISNDTWGWWLHIGCISVPLLFYHFSLIWTHNPNRRLLRISYGLFFTFILLNTFTDSFTGENVFRTYYNYPKPAILYPVYIAYFQFYGLLSTWQVFELRKKIVAEDRKYLFIYLIVHLLAWTGAMDNYLIMYDRLIFPLYPYGLYLILPYIVVGSFAFLKLNASNSITQEV